MALIPDMASSSAALNLLLQMLFSVMAERCFVPHPALMPLMGIGDTVHMIGQLVCSLSYLRIAIIHLFIILYGACWRTAFILMRGTPLIL